MFLSLNKTGERGQYKSIDWFDQAAIQHKQPKRVKFTNYSQFFVPRFLGLRFSFLCYFFFTYWYIQLDNDV